MRGRRPSLLVEGCVAETFGDHQHTDQFDSVIDGRAMCPHRTVFGVKPSWQALKQLPISSSGSFAASFAASPRKAELTPWMAYVGYIFGTHRANVHIAGN